MAKSAESSELCRNCHEFFGTAQTLYLCSQCFKTHRPPEEAKQQSVGRCPMCSRKVGVTSFLCKCGSTFCTNCRQPEVHFCAFDHRAQGLRQLTESNPLVTAEKVNKI